MKVKLTSTAADYGNGKLKKKYIRVFNPKENKGKNWADNTQYSYEIEVSSVEELFKIAKKLDRELIILPETEWHSNTVEIYDDCRE